MSEFVSEPLDPHGGQFDTRAMATGAPGLPAAFTWRGEIFPVRDVLEWWKASGPEVGRLHGERYLRRHYWRIRVSSGAVWTVYFVRQSPGGSGRRRWYLYSVDSTAADT